MATVLNPTGAPSVFGGLGRLEWAPTNGPDDLFPTWSDLTPYVRTELRPLDIATRGRASELDVTESNVLTCDLDNTDGRFTFGLTSGPYGSNWAPARRVRYSETVGGRTFPLFTGWIEYPDIADWQPIGLQFVQLSCTDRRTRLGRGAPFFSTLGAHIMGSGSTLKAYYPLTDTAGTVATTPLNQPALPITSAAGENAFAGQATLQLANAVGPPGDDVTFPTWTTHLNSLNSTDGALGFNVAVPYVHLTQPVTISGTDKLALVAWANLGTTAAVDDQLVAFFQGAIPAVDIRRHNGVGGNWRMSMTFDLVNFLNFDHPATVATQKWTQVAARLSLSPNSQEIWVDGVVAASAVGGSPPASVTFDELSIANPWVGSLAHVQVYVLPGAVDFAAFLAAQRQVGLTGLERQLTGQRISTILDYAGVPSTDRAVDPGVSYMQKATLAGLDPLTAIQDAVDTERGRGFTAGDGRFTFHDRIRVLNV